MTKSVRPYSWEQEPEGEGDYFLDRNTFEKTKQQRQEGER